ncbi:MAG: AbrB/MazE/SpoVT family DNA-binding domain-containing protein [Planctomycetes bacterium]|nr:AbrB/MazE/SpoVT family DNA-binding domain-containing protein [Planctomycetota bacterium]
MVKKLTKHGNSYALIIDKPVMELLNITPESPLEISTDGKSLIIRPAATARQEKFDNVLDQICKQYHAAFKKLAD